MTDQLPAPFFLIVIDHDQRLFCVEGPMTDDQPWRASTRRAQDMERRVVCGPTGLDRQTLAAEYQRAHGLGAVPPGSIVRVRQ